MNARWAPLPWRPSRPLPWPLPRLAPSLAPWLAPRLAPRRAIRGALLVTLVAGACARAGGDADPRTGGGVSFERGAVVLTGRALQDGTGTLLSTMVGKVPNFRVRRAGERCPEIALRNYSTFESNHNPHVYVDGTRTTDTCVLETLRAGDVDRVEVYPQGFTTRPGYATHAPGLILVFMQGGRSAPRDLGFH